jgi:hypothetical protein
MGQLPVERVNPSFANDMVSVDYPGPVSVKAGSKRKPTYHKAYVYCHTVFVCLQTKSCHIELVSDLTAEAFVAALRRFVARRGKPLQIWSDNATCFTRANKDLKEFHDYLKEVETQNTIATVLHKVCIGNLVLPLVRIMDQCGKMVSRRASTT